MPTPAYLSACGLQQLQLLETAEARPPILTAGRGSKGHFGDARDTPQRKRKGGHREQQQRQRGPDLARATQHYNWLWEYLGIIGGGQRQRGEFGEGGTGL